MKVHLVGNLTEDPELRYTANGIAQVRLRVAENHRFKKASGEWAERTSFHTVIAWRELAENVATSFSKGTRVIVIGDQEDRSFTTADGQNRTVKEINADDIGPSARWATMTVSKVARSAAGGGGSAPQAPPAQRPEPQPMQASPDDFDPFNEEPF